MPQLKNSNATYLVIFKQYAMGPTGQTFSLTVSVCPLMQLLINGVHPTLSLAFKSMFLNDAIREKSLVFISILSKKK